MNKEDWYKTEFWNINKLISNNNSLSLCDFLKIRNFKIQNSSIATEEEIRTVTKEAFELAERDEIKEAIKKLCTLYGVKIPVASAILAMKYPDKFAIIDINVISALDKKEEWIEYATNSSIYQEYTLLLRNMAKEKDIKNLRDLEYALFVRGKHKRTEDRRS